MYLRKGERQGCGCFLAFFILAGVATLLAEGWMVAAIWGALALVPGILLWSHYGTEASRLVHQFDVLLHSLKVEAVPELKGVQWVLMVSPDPVLVPANVVIALIVQNCHGRPRIVSGTVKGIPGAAPFKITLLGGEAGVYRIPVLLGPETRPGPVRFRVDLKVRVPEGIGWRVIAREGGPPSRHPEFRDLELDVTGSHPGEALNPFAPRQAGYCRLFITGQPQPDTEPMRLLDDLRGTPS